MVRLLVHLKEVHRGVQVLAHHRAVGRVTEDTVITATDVDRHRHLQHLLRLPERILLIRPLHHSNRHQFRPVRIQPETGTPLLRPRLSSSRDSTLEGTSTQAILHHLLMLGQVLLAEVRLPKEVHKQPDLTMGAGVHLREAGCSQDKQAVMEEVKLLLIALVVRIQLQAVVAWPELLAAA